jgi:hypothetical protein
MIHSKSDPSKGEERPDQIAGEIKRRPEVEMLLVQP